MLFFLLKHTLCFLNSYASCRYQLFSLKKPPLTSAEAKSSMKGSSGIRHLYFAALVTVAILPLSLQLLSISSTRFKIYKGRAHSHFINYYILSTKPYAWHIAGSLQIFTE